MEYRFLEKFPHVKIHITADGLTTVWIFRRAERMYESGQGVELISFCGNMDLLGMAYPKAILTLEKTEELFLTDGLRNCRGLLDDFYWVNESGQWR